MLDVYVQEAFLAAAHQMQMTYQDQRAPHVLMRPAIFPDGNQWCALYGEDLQRGIAGFGNTPALAASDFDRNWAAQTLRTHGVKGLGDAD